MTEEYNFSGDFRGSILNIKSRLVAVSQSIGNNVSDDEEITKKLTDLVNDLTTELEKVPSENLEDAEVITELTEEFVEKSKQEKPSRKLLEIKGDSLKKAAENIASVTPQVVVIASQIVNLILKTKLNS